MVIVRFPCEMAQLEIFTREVATIVPVRSLMMIRAGVSGVTSIDSSRAIKSTGGPSSPSGLRTRSELVSSACELRGNFGLMVVEIKEAKVKSGSRQRLAIAL